MKYIIFDLDDTLLNKESKITPFTYDILKKCQELGHKIIINTARSHNYSLEYIDELKPDYSILNGGALILGKDKETLFECCISENISNALICDLYKIVENEGLSAETNNGLYAWHPESTNQKATYFDFSKPLNKSCFKILCCKSKHDELYQLAEKYDVLYTPYYGGLWGRFTRKDATKWLGIVNLMNLIGGDLKDTITFGDDIGDLEMLQKAGIGVCVSNAQPSVLDVLTPLTCASYEDGVAKFLQKYFELI